MKAPSGASPTLLPPPRHPMSVLRMLHPALVLGSAISCAPPPIVRTDAALSEHAYVWQRAWTPAVHEAVAMHDFDGLGALSHEVSWHDGQARIHRVGLVDFEGVRVVRVAVPPEGVDLPTVLDPVFDGVCADGPIHLDLDMPSRRLSEYADWVDRLSERCELRITALPTWLDEPSFVELGRQGFVLQVHWFDPARPRGPLLQSDAREAIEKAGALGIPFEVALPAYGHRIWLRHGELVGLESEAARTPPSGATSELVMADPVAVSSLLRSLREAHPPSLKGLWWFRLPTARDRLAWSPRTLGAVRAGESLVARVETVWTSESTGERTLCLHNAGTVPWLPEAVPVPGPLAGGRLGWSFSPARHALLPPPASRPLQPGDERCIGWSRPLVNHAL